MYLRGKLSEKKVFLWSLFLLQVFLIGFFLVFGSSFSDLDDVNGGNSHHDSAVQFVSKSNGNDEFPNERNNLVSGNQQRITVNASGVYANEFEGKLHCFRDGLVQNRNGTSQECVCQLDYHGKDCGQPEVLWRAFMNAKVPLNLSATPRPHPHKIFYMIRTIGGAASIETLEIQLMELIQVVDLFIICDHQDKGTTNNKDRLLKQNAKTGFLKQFRYKILLLDDDHTMCTLKTMYRHFRSRMAPGMVSDDDILVISNNDEILNWRAIKYFKWYDHWPQPTRFRLKYTVYGYYWQHPESTRLGSAACQISVLEEVFKSDPERVMLGRKPGMIVGDLNHVGGWYCQYCYHPLNIVKKLMVEAKDLFAHNRIQIIDESYVESLIANGLYVDGKLGLTRLHRFADKYYAPEYITNASWKYESILSNVYATYDDDYAN